MNVLKFISRTDHRYKNNICRGLTENSTYVRLKYLTEFMIGKPELHFQLILKYQSREGSLFLCYVLEGRII
ncbi:CLUMA_CG013035, isoform A [Clunio marinus]|uniref:CLUMA_CG013035, isoform A n=1 Tax=Clunio marinus TaxID=568069 RepID=A0A1J1IMS8_9DIPT|nr:CLUMA_CG013035, isoform A [Clunio marinus]